MCKELLFFDEMPAELYLEKLIQAYPYAIEKRLVYSLLDDICAPHPMLIAFIRFYQTIYKIHIVHDSNIQLPQLETLYQKMCHVVSQDSALYFMHQYAFDVTYLLRAYDIPYPYAHLPLQQIPFLTQVQMHTVPLIQMTPLQDKLPMTRSSSFIYKHISLEPKAFTCVCIRIEDKYGLIFLSNDCLSFAGGLAALYTVTQPVANYEFMLIYGLKTPHDTCAYYYDETNRLYIGLVSGQQKIYHFHYLKDMILTLFNSICIEKQDLPIHAAMINLLTPTHMGIVFCGITGSGKTEMLDAVTLYCEKQHIPYQPVYDDNGILHYLDNIIVSTGSETGACKNISYMRKDRVFPNLRDSFFMQENDTITWQITPLTTHACSMEFHPIQCFCYINPHATFKGIRRITQMEAFLTHFLQMNPLIFHCGTPGCYDQKAKVKTFIQEFFTVMFVQNIPIYEISSKASTYQKQTLFQHLTETLFTKFLFP